MVNNVPICTYVTEVQAENFTIAEKLLLATVPADNVEYLITIVK